MPWLLARHSTAPTREYYAVIQRAQCWWATTCGCRDEESNPGPPGSETSTLPLGHRPSPYLDIRTQFVRLGGTVSGTTMVVAVVPQRSVLDLLGPALFICYTSEIIKIIVDAGFSVQSCARRWPSDFFFCMLAQSYTPNIYTPTPIPFLYHPFTSVLDKRLSAYLFRAAHTHTCLLKGNKERQRLPPCYAAANREPGLLAKSLAYVNLE